MLMQRLVLLFFLFGILGMPGQGFAHPLPGDPQGLDEQLTECSFDLFRARRPQGGFYAAHVQRVARNLLDRQFQRFFEQNNSYPPAYDRELSAQLSGPITMFATNLAYRELFAPDLDPYEQFLALIGTFHTVENGPALRAVVGTSSPVVVDGAPYPAELVGAVILAAVVLDLQETIERIPQVALHRLGEQLGNTNWSLDGLPLSPLAFDALVAEVETSISTGAAEDRIALAGGPCIHAHPRVLNSLGLGIYLGDSDEGDAQMDGSEPVTTIDGGTIDVSAPAPPPAPPGTPIGGGIPGANGRPGPSNRGSRPASPREPDQPLASCNNLDQNCSSSGNCPNCQACFNCCVARVLAGTLLCDRIIRFTPGAEGEMARIANSFLGKRCLGLHTPVIQRCQQECAAHFVANGATCPDIDGFFND